MDNSSDSVALQLSANIPRTTNARRMTIITPSVPHPSSGASSVLFYWYTYALKLAGYQILNILVIGDERDVAKVEEYKKTIGENESFNVEYIVSETPIVYNKWIGPKAVEKKLVTQIAKLADDFQTEVLTCFDLTSAWAASTCKAPFRVVWLGDLNFQSFYYHAVYAFQRGDYRLAVINLIYSYPWKRLYVEALTGFSKIVVSSGSSVKALAKLGLSSEYLSYPWPPAIALARAPQNTPTFAFFGNLGALGSLSSLGCLVSEIYPGLIKELGKNNFAIKIFGFGKMPPFVQKAILGANEIQFLGFIPDLNAELATCHAMIAPIEAPVGNRSRIVTAMACHLPVVTHINAAKGNPDLENDVNCCLGGDAPAMVKSLVKLTTEKQYADDIAKNGHQLYLDKFHPVSACLMFLKTLENSTLPSFK